MFSDIVIFERSDTSSTSFSYFVSCGFQVYTSNITNKCLVFLFRLCRKFNIYSYFLTILFWNINKKKILKSSMIIIFDNSIERYFCNCIHRYFSQIKLILCYWNTIDLKKEIDINNYRQLWNIYSFDLNDCNKYNLKFNKLFFPVHNDNINQRFEIKQDVIFVGKNKGRIAEIVKILNEFDKIGILYKIICPDADNLKNDKIINKRISYDEVLAEDMNSRAILDINGNDIYGMTMRELEALFLKKKLITNNIMIKNRDYYHPDNVYIIDYTNTPLLRGFKDFLEKPFVPVNDDVMNSYSVESWSRRF